MKVKIIIIHWRGDAPCIYKVGGPACGRYMKWTREVACTHTVVPRLSPSTTNCFELLFISGHDKLKVLQFWLTKPSGPSPWSSCDVVNCLRLVERLISPLIWPAHHLI